MDAGFSGLHKIFKCFSLLERIRSKARGKGGAKSKISNWSYAVAVKNNFNKTTEKISLEKRLAMTFVMTL